MYLHKEIKILVVISVVMVLSYHFHRTSLDQTQKQTILNDGNFIFYNYPVAQKTESEIFLAYMTRYGLIEVAKIVEDKDKFIIETTLVVHDYSNMINYDRGRAADDHAAPAIILNNKSKKLYLATAYHGTDLHIYVKDMVDDRRDFVLIKTVKGRYTYPRFFHFGEHIFLLVRKQNVGVRDGDLVILSSQDNFSSEKVLIASGQGRVVYASTPLVSSGVLYLQYSTLSYASGLLEGWNLLQLNLTDNQSKDIDLSKYIPANCISNRPTGIGLDTNNNLNLATACFMDDGFKATTLGDRFFSRNNKIRIVALSLNLISKDTAKIIHDGDALAPYYHTSVSFNAKGNWLYFDDTKIISDLNWSECDVSDGNAMYPSLFGNLLFYARPNAGFYEIRDFDSSIRYCLAS